MFEINSEKTTGYVLHETSGKNVLVCKILKECPSKKEATKDLVRLLTKKATEKQLLEENGKRMKD